MTDKALKGLYPRLRRDERFRLAVEAAARNDWDEVGALAGSCPTYRYRATDLTYTDRLSAASFIALAAANLLLRAEVALAPHAFGRELLADMRALMTAPDSTLGDGLPIDAGDGEGLEIGSEDKRREMDELYRERVAALLGVCEGVERFCETLKVEPANLLGIEPACLSAWHSAGRLRGKDIAADPETAEAVYRDLQGLWSRMVDDQESKLQGFIER
jgi:hypothetical protein